MKTQSLPPPGPQSTASRPEPPFLGLEFIGEVSRHDELPVPWIRTELYFAFTAVDGTSAKTVWHQFLREVVTPRFPAGFTVIPGYGQWRNSAGRIERLSSRVLVIVAPDSNATDAALNEIIGAWKERTGEESVLRVTVAARVRF